MKTRAAILSSLSLPRPYAVPALELAWAVTPCGGTTVTAGLPHPDKLFALRHVLLVVEERSLKGSYLGSAVSVRDVPRCIDWYRRGELPVDRLLSERLRLDDINVGFDRLAEANTIRQVVVFD